MDLTVIGTSALAGAVFGLVGYFRHKKQDQVFNGFNKTDFLTTVFGAAIIGGGASYLGLTFNELSSSAFGVMVTEFLKKLFKSLK